MVVRIVRVCDLVLYSHEVSLWTSAKIVGSVRRVHGTRRPRFEAPCRRFRRFLRESCTHTAVCFFALILGIGVRGGTVHRRPAPARLFRVSLPNRLSRNASVSGFHGHWKKLYVDHPGQAADVLDVYIYLKTQSIVV